jgi:hypothetical protein
MGCQPVQRHRWARSAWRTVASVGSVRAATRMMMPGVQKPHWLPPAAQNASAHRSALSSPSSVVTDRPATRPTGVTHATRGWPSTHTVQHPH